MIALTSADLRLIHAVAARRRHGEEQSPGLEAPPPQPDLSAFARAAELAVSVLAGAPADAGLRETALLAIFCQLRLDGLELMAPQGVAAGMILDLASGRTDVRRLADWLQDRAISL